MVFGYLLPLFLGLVVLSLTSLHLALLLLVQEVPDFLAELVLQLLYLLNHSSDVNVRQVVLLR